MHKKDDQLLNAMAQAYENLSDPFHIEFLREHNVSADDCCAMSTLMATLIRGYLSAPEWVQKAMLASGVMEPHIREWVWLQARGDDALKRLANVDLVKAVEVTPVNDELLLKGRKFKQVTYGDVKPGNMLYEEGAMEWFKVLDVVGYDTTSDEIQCDGGLSVTVPRTNRCYIAD